MTDLSKLPPPEEGAGEGYYPDPLGGKYQRWWDGEKWTYQVGPEQPVSAQAPRAAEPGVVSATAPPLPPDKSELVPRRPRDIGQIVEATFRLYRRYPLLFLTLASGVIVTYDVVVLITTGAAPFLYAGLPFGTQIIVGVVSWVLVGPLISALHVHAVADVRDGKDPEIGPVARRGLEVLPVVAATTIMAGLGTALGLLALIVPGVILFFRWFVAAQVAAIEHEGWLPALRGSRQLTAGNYTQILIFILVLALMVGVPGNVLSLVFGRDNSGAAAVVVGMVVHLFTASFSALSTALLYYDLIARKGTVAEARQ